MMEGKKKAVLIVPSEIVARGLKGIFSDHGEFVIIENLHDLSSTGEARLRTLDPDIILVDPSVVNFHERKDLRSRLAALSKASAVIIEGLTVTEDILKQFDGSISIYDDPVAIVRKLRMSMDAGQSNSASEGNELSSREKEILVCVAKGMLNKEIADKLNLSIHTIITHRKNITRKTGIKTVAGLTVYAILNNLIDMGAV